MPIENTAQLASKHIAALATAEELVYSQLIQNAKSCQILIVLQFFANLVEKQNLAVLH